MRVFMNGAHFLLFVFLSLVTGGSALTKVHDQSFKPDAVLRVTQQVIQQPCVSARSTVLINGTSPGPELRITEGKTYWIRVYNDMEAHNLTMHWHGLTMAVSPFSDGAPLASQWPIPSSYFFDYEIHVPIGMAGTYFYHSHVGFQAVSATAPLIVEDARRPPYKYSGERIVFLQDVFVKDDLTIEKGLVSTPLNWSGESAMILVNGKGGGSSNGTKCEAELAVINVQPGKTYRFRFVAATALTFASLAIEDHEDLQIIEADGSYTKRHSTPFLQIGAGQRFSVLLTTKKQPSKKQYHIQIESRDRPTITQSFAILNYGSKPKDPIYPPEPPTLTLPDTDLDFLEYALRPLHDNDSFPTADEVTRRITLTVHQRVNGQTTWLTNGHPWTEDVPREPYLVSLYKQDTASYPSLPRALENNGIDPVTGVFPAQIGEVLEIVFQNTGADRGGLDAHPWHAHGAHYWDIGSGNGTYDLATNEAKLKNAHPVLRDTTMLYRYQLKTTNGTQAGWRAWRLRVDQPGVWMVHCHVLQHMIMGMQSVWVMGNATEVLKLNKPDVEGYLIYGGSVTGNKTHWPEVVESYGAWTAQQ